MRMLIFNLNHGGAEEILYAYPGGAQEILYILTPDHKDQLYCLIHLLTTFI